MASTVAGEVKHCAQEVQAPNSEVKVRGCTPRVVRISMTDPNATDSSSDEEDVNHERGVKKVVTEIHLIPPGFQNANDAGQGAPNTKRKHNGDGSSSTGVKFRGVRQRKWGTWGAEIRERGSRQKLWLGTYPTPEDAALAYDQAAIKLHGHRAVTNLLPPPTAPAVADESSSSKDAVPQPSAASAVADGSSSSKDAVPQPSAAPAVADESSSSKDAVPQPSAGARKSATGKPIRIKIKCPCPICKMGSEK